MDSIDKTQMLASVSSPAVLQPLPVALLPLNHIHDTLHLHTDWI